MQDRKLAMKLDLKKYFWKIALLLAVNFQLNAAGNDAALWKNANQFYAQKKYDSAARIYELLLKENSTNAELHYNTGNAYYKLNKIGLAILHYEKAAHLNPSDKEINDNLLLATSKVQDNMQIANPIFFVAWWNALNHAVSANAWAVLAFVMFLILLSLIYFSRIKRGDFQNSGRWIALSVVSFLLCATMTWIAYSDFLHSDKAVVTTTNAVFLQSPQNNGKIIGSLPEGLVLEILGKKDGFLNVQLQNGKSGWIAISEVGIV